MNKTRKILLMVAGFFLLVGYMTYLTMAPGRVTCEVCIDFHGQGECRKSTGKDKDEAQTSAISTACGLVAGGVTDVIACQNTPPKSVSCQDR